MALTITDGDFQDVLGQETRPVLLVFQTPWCGPCQIQAPIVEKFEEDVGERIVIGIIDVDESPVLAEHFQIREIPAVVLLKENREIARATGLQPREALDRLLEQMAEE